MHWTQGRSNLTPIVETPPPNEVDKDSNRIEALLEPSSAKPAKPAKIKAVKKAKR